MQTLCRLIILVLIAFSSTNAIARDYIVEAIVFSNEGAAGASNELWSPESDRVKKAQGNLSEKFAAANAPLNPLGLNQLAGIRNALANSGQHRILKTLAWTQAEYNYRDSPLIKVTGVNLLGAIRVYAPNLLFVELNLRYADVANTSIGTTSPKYYINEKRKLKLNETHYFDHPKFGVIVMVRPKENS